MVVLALTTEGLKRVRAGGQIDFVASLELSTIIENGLDRIDILVTALGETALLARPDAGPSLLTIDPFEETVLLVREQVYNAGMPSFAASVRLLDLPVKTFCRRGRSTVETLMKIG